MAHHRQPFSSQRSTAFFTSRSIQGPCPLMSLRLGSKLVVIGSTPEAATEIFKTHDRALSGRNTQQATMMIGRNEELNRFSVGFSDCNEELWKRLRTLYKTELFSNSALNETARLREEKVREMVSYLGGKRGQVVKVKDFVSTVVMNVLSNSFHSIDFVDFEGEGVGREMMELIQARNDTLGAPNFSEFFTVLRGFDVQGLKKRARKVQKRIGVVWEDIMKERRRQTTRDDGVVHGRDLFDVLLQHGFTPDQTNTLIQELLAAGSDATITPIEFTMAELMKNSNAMQSLREELTREVGVRHKRSLKESDLTNLPYLNACVKESMTLHPPLPLLLPHRAIEPCELMGYAIPQNAEVMVNVSAIGRDPSIWGDPLRFKPERFLENNRVIDYKGSDFEFIPFGAGRRMCPAWTLVARAVPLIVGTLVYEFDWVLAGGMQSHELDLDSGNGSIPMRMDKPLLLIPM